MIYKRFVKLEKLEKLFWETSLLMYVFKQISK